VSVSPAHAAPGGAAVVTLNRTGPTSTALAVSFTVSGYALINPWPPGMSITPRPGGAAAGPDADGNATIPAGAASGAFAITVWASAGSAPRSSVELRVVPGAGYAPAPSPGDAASLAIDAPLPVRTGAGERGGARAPLPRALAAPS
jgi:hypothetical protein